MNEQVPAEKRFMPSTDTLREWAASPHNGQCWGLGEIADELDELRRSLRREENARKVLADENKRLTALVGQLQRQVEFMNDNRGARP